MTGRRLIVTGTGTGIGKTHVSEALLLAWRSSGRSCAGLKPVESGVTAETVTDAARLAAASTFHVKPGPYAFPDPVSPHLAARRAGAVISFDAVSGVMRAAATEVDWTLLELPGGLFTPVTDDALNADLARALRADALVLVAPDRLGVLHDVIAATRAAAALGLRPSCVLLVATPEVDASTGSNASELEPRVDVPVLGPAPRATPHDLAGSTVIQSLVALLERVAPARV